MDRMEAMNKKMDAMQRDNEILKGSVSKAKQDKTRRDQAKLNTKVPEWSPGILTRSEGEGNAMKIVEYALIDMYHLPSQDGKQYVRVLLTNKENPYFPNDEKVTGKADTLKYEEFVKSVKPYSEVLDDETDEKSIPRGLQAVKKQVFYARNKKTEDVEVEYNLFNIPLNGDLCEAWIPVYNSNFS